MTAMRFAGIAVILAAGLVGAYPKVTIADDASAAAPCSFAAGRDVSNNTVTCNFGLTPEQLKQVTKAAVEGATEPLLDRIATISQKLGVTEDAAKTLLKIIGEDPGVPEDKLAEALSKVAADYKRLQAQAAALNPENPTARGLVAQAKSEIDAGRLSRAHELLHEATQAQVAAAQEAEKFLQQAQAAKDAQLLGAASSTATEGDVALTERQYTQAAELYRQAAGLVPDGHADVRRHYLGQEANALYQQGDERGDNAAAQQAIERYQALLKAEGRAADPLGWAVAQNSLGIALERLGERESGTAHLDEAVAAYRAALQEWTRDRAPFDWARVQNNLGFALGRLGSRESGTAHLDEAVTAFRAALEEQTRDRVPLNWATVQMNLGNALSRIGERESGTAHLEEAIAAYRAALEENTRDRVPLSWAWTQNDLGIALKRLGEREGGTAHLDEAVAAYRAALQELKRDRVPLDWARTQNNLGGALRALGDRESGTAHLEEAVAAYRAALEENTRDRVPLSWAMAQNNLGIVLERLGERESGTAHLDEAVAAYRAALQEWTRAGRLRTADPAA
jgi:tetratricopeptide (TPR) repeat protein